MSVEGWAGKWYITKRRVLSRMGDGEPCESCWPDSHNDPPPDSPLATEPTT